MSESNLTYKVVPCAERVNSNYVCFFMSEKVGDVKMQIFKCHKLFLHINYFFLLLVELVLTFIYYH